MDPLPSTDSPTAIDGRKASQRWLASTGWLVAGRAIGSLCTFGILFQLARSLSLPAFGRITFYMALFAVLGNLVDLGTGQTLIQRSTREPASLGPLLRTATRVRFGMAALCAAVMILWAWWAGEAELGWLAASAATLFASVWELSNTPARNAMRLRTPVLVRAGGSLLSLAAVTWLLRTGEHRVGPLLFALLAGAALANWGQHMVLRPQLPPKARQAAPFRPYWSLTWPLGIGALCSHLAFWIDNALIRGWFGDEVLGLYNLPVRLFSFSILVAVLAPSAALPHLSRAHAQGRLGPVISRMAPPLFAVGIFGGTLLWVWAPDVLPWFGPAFADSLTVMRILVFALVAVHAGAFWTMALVAAGQTQPLLRWTASGLALNFIGNLLVLPIWGIEAAAVTTVATEIWIRGGTLRYLMRTGVQPFSAWGARTAVILSGALVAGWVCAHALLPALRWLMEVTAG